MTFEIDLNKIDSWKDFHDHFYQEYGFEEEGEGLVSWIKNLKKATVEETLFIIKNPMIVYGDSTNKYRDLLLQMITVINSERYAENKTPTIKIVFTQA